MFLNQDGKQMRGPNLRKLVRSLRTKSYEKLSIRKHLAALSKGSAWALLEISQTQEFDPGQKSHRQIKFDKNVISNLGSETKGRSN